MSDKLEPKVGAWVHITSRYDQSVAKIDKVGKTHFTVGAQKFSNRNGWLAGGHNKWHITSAKVITQERANELKAEFTKERIGREARGFIESSCRSMSNEVAIKVAEYIKSLQQ